MAAETLGNASTGTYVFMLLLGFFWALWPLAIITNFRGYRDSHARRTLRTSGLLRRVPPYRWLKSDPAADRRFMTATQYFVATVHLLVAVALIVLAVVGIVRRITEG
jgi:hypothetical protein